MALLLQTVKLTPENAKKWSDTRAALIWHCPAFTHILISMLHNTGSEELAVFVDCPEIPVAATDGSNVILNTGPQGFFSFPLNQRVFILAHEIMHCILNHMVLSHHFKMRGKVAFKDGTDLPFDPEQMNCAEDYVINACLVESKIGQMPQRDGKQFGLLDTAIATSKDNSLDTYQKIYKKPKSGGGGGDNNGNGSGRFDTHLPPGTSIGKDPVSAAADRNQAAWDTEIQSAKAVAKAMGKLPGALQRVLDELLEPQVNWQEKIRAMFARKVGSGTYDWKRPDRRLITRDIYAPGRSGFGANAVVVAVDTSGSIGKKELDMFMAEMAGILEDVKPRRLVIMWCDAHVHRVDECEEVDDLRTVRAKGAPGGGGTSFIPVFERIDEMGLQPEALVYLTDGLGSFPDRAPSYPVIWGSIFDTKYPWGEVVDIPKQK